MIRIVLLALACCFLAAPVLAADKPALLEGTYVRTVGDNEITLAFSKDGTLELSLKAAGGGTLTAVCDYGITKDNILFAVISKIDVAGISDAPEAGLPFSFKLDRKDGEILVSNLKGTDNDGAKNLVEGTYKKK